jgi:hypothetical protein
VDHLSSPRCDISYKWEEPHSLKIHVLFSSSCSLNAASVIVKLIQTDCILLARLVEGLALLQEADKSQSVVFQMHGLEKHLGPYVSICHASVTHRYSAA